MTEWAAACMSPDEWSEWMRLNPRTIAGAATRPCDDCPMGFAADMRAEGRCNGTPMGVEEDEEAPAVSLTTIPVLVSPPPCDTCIHAPICSLRASVEDVSRTDVEVPQLAKGLTMVVAADIQCAHYLRAKGTTTATGRAPRVMTPEGIARLREGAMKTQAKLAAKRAAAVESTEAA